jgi:hypothetical protein
MFMQRVSVYPSPQSIAEIRSLLVDRVTLQQGRGIRVALSELVAGSKTPQFVVTTLFEDLAAFEVQRKQYSDPESQKLVAKLASLVRKPLAYDLLEVLVPMPS